MATSEDLALFWCRTRCTRLSCCPPLSAVRSSDFQTPAKATAAVSRRSERPCDDDRQLGRRNSSCSNIVFIACTKPGRAWRAEDASVAIARNWLKSWARGDLRQRSRNISRSQLFYGEGAREIDFLQQGRHDIMSFFEPVGCAPPRFWSAASLKCVPASCLYIGRARSLSRSRSTTNTV